MFICLKEYKLQATGWKYRLWSVHLVQVSIQLLFSFSKTSWRLQDNFITALFTNIRILKFKSQLTIAFSAAVNHLNGPLRKQNFKLTGSKGHGLWFVIGGFRAILRVSVFQGSLLVIVVMIDGSEKRNCEGSFWPLEFACLWKAQ